MYARDLDHIGVLHLWMNQHANPVITSENQTSEQNARNVSDKKQNVADINATFKNPSLDDPRLLNISDTVCNVMLLVLANPI